MKRIFRLVAWVAAVGMALSAIGQTAPSPSKLPFTISKETTRITSPLLPDGSPDYVGALNKQLSKGVTPENNGFVQWVQVADGDKNFWPPGIRERTLDLCGAKLAPADAVSWHSFDNFGGPGQAISDPELFEFDDLRYELWSPEAHPWDAKFLKSNEKSLDLACRAAARPKWWMPYVSKNGSLFAFLPLPSPGIVREMCMVLDVRATLRAKAGDFDGFLTDVLATKQLAHHLANGMTVVEALNGHAIDRHTNDAIGTVVGSGMLTAAQCAKLQQTFATLPAYANVSEVADIEERYELLDAAVILATGKGAMFKEFIGEGLSSIDTEAVDWDSVLKTLNRAMDDEVVLLNAPALSAIDAESEKTMEVWSKGLQTDKEVAAMLTKAAGETKEAYSQRIAHVLLMNFMPALAGIEGFRRQLLLQNEMLQVLLIAAKSKANTGKWPEKLEDLVPRELKQIPLDPYSRNGAFNVQYNVTDGHALIYSLGRNGLDNSGKGDDIPAGFNPHPPVP